MASYTIEWKSSAKKELRKLSPQIIKRIVTAVAELATTPHPVGSRKLIGSRHTYRLRIGDYRVLYNTLDDKLIIEIVRVAHRKDVYR
jgi:mRNA interferase RelE/StbE